MSENVALIVAIIGATGAVVAALISGTAAIISARIQKQRKLDDHPTRASSKKLGPTTVASKPEIATEKKRNSVKIEIVRRIKNVTFVISLGGVTVSGLLLLRNFRAEGKLEFNQSEPSRNPTPCANPPVSTVRIALTMTPPFGDGGPTKTEQIAGTVSGVGDKDYRIVVYAKTDHWWVQPTDDEPITGIHSDGTWNTQTHLGHVYGVLLVKPSFVPPLQDEVLPSGPDIVASTVVSERGQ